MATAQSQKDSAKADKEAANKQQPTWKPKPQTVETVDGGKFHKEVSAAFANAAAIAATGRKASVVVVYHFEGMPGQKGYAETDWNVNVKTAPVKSDKRRICEVRKDGTFLQDPNQLELVMGG